MGASSVHIGLYVVNCPTHEIEHVRALVQRANDKCLLSIADVAAVLPERANDLTAAMPHRRHVLLSDALRWVGADIVATKNVPVPAITDRLTHRR